MKNVLFCIALCTPFVLFAQNIQVSLAAGKQITKVAIGTFNGGTPQKSQIVKAGETREITLPITEVKAVNCKINGKNIHGHLYIRYLGIYHSGYMYDNFFVEDSVTAAHFAQGAMLPYNPCTGGICFGMSSLPSYCHYS